MNPYAVQIVQKMAYFSGGGLSASHGQGYVYGGGFESGGAKFADGIPGDGSGVGIDHRRTRQNARRFYHENLIARSLINRHTDTVADVGLVYESAPMFKLLGISQEESESWAADMEQKFLLWSLDKAAHRSEKFNFFQSHRLYATAQKRDGENFVRFYYSSDRNLQNPLQFEFVDAEQLTGDAYTDTHGNFSIRDGIKKDARGREIGYEVRVKKQTKTGVIWKTVSVPAKAGGGRPLMIHGFAPEYAGQTRGYSQIGHALQEFQNLTDFSLAAIMKAINQSQFWMFNKPSSDAPSSDPFEDINNVQAGPVVEQFGAEPEPASDARQVTKEALRPVHYYRPPREAFQTPGSSAILNLEAGEEIKPFESSAAAEEYNKFVDAFAAYLSASTNTPVEIMLMRFNRSYSASRAALIMFWRVCKIHQMEMASDYLFVALEAWMSEEIAAGKIIAPGWSDPRLKKAWLNGTWHGAPMPNIDPQRTAKADSIYVHELNAKSLKRVAREQFGADIDRNQARLKKEFQNFPESPLNKKSTEAA